MTSKAQLPNLFISLWWEYSRECRIQSSAKHNSDVSAIRVVCNYL